MKQQDLKEALDLLEKEKNISKSTLIEAIQQSIIQACKQHFGKAENIHVNVDPQTGAFRVYAEKLVCEEVEDPVEQISLEAARNISSRAAYGETVQVPIQSDKFGRIITQNAKNIILQKIREEERRSLYDQYFSLEKEIVTGIVQRVGGPGISINLGKVDATMNENEQVRGEKLKPLDRIKVYILEVKDTSKGPRIMVSRTHPGLVKKLFEAEVAEVKDGTVEIKSIAREAGSRTKIAVASNDPDVDPVGACVGMNGARVGAVVDELRGEKIDIVNWDDNPAILIENTLSPAKVIAVLADPDEKTALVVVPDYQLSLAIGKEGQNARLAAKLTGYRIDIKSETQAKEAGVYYDYDDDEYGYEEDEEYAGFEDYGGFEDLPADVMQDPDTAGADVPVQDIPYHQNDYRADGFDPEDDGADYYYGEDLYNRKDYVETPNDRESGSPDYYGHRDYDTGDGSGASNAQFHDDSDGDGSRRYRQEEDLADGDEKNYY